MSNQIATPAAVEQIERFLRVRGWERRGVNAFGEVEYTKGRDEWQVQISPDGWWSLNKFTDRYESQDEGDSLKGLEEAMVSAGAMAWECPACGESGGEPRTKGWSEFQGCAEHGGMVDFTEDGCSKCMGRS